MNVSESKPRCKLPENPQHRHRYDAVMAGAVKRLSGSCIADQFAFFAISGVLRVYASVEAQEGVGFGQKFEGFLAAEGVQAGVVEAGGKQAVGDGFGVEVGKVGGADVVDEVFFEFVFGVGVAAASSRCFF